MAAGDDSEIPGKSKHVWRAPPNSDCPRGWCWRDTKSNNARQQGVKLLVYCYLAVIHSPSANFKVFLNEKGGGGVHGVMLSVFSTLFVFQSIVWRYKLLAALNIHFVVLISNSLL
jgi:hypothetical protein